MSERARPGDPSQPSDETDRPVKRFDGPFRFRGYYDQEPDGICQVRVFQRGAASPVIVLSEDPANPTTSITNLMEYLAPEVIRRFCPERFEHDEPVILLEHYPEARSQRGRITHEETWDRVSFASWTPRPAWLGGHERLSLGEPEWQRLPLEEVDRLIGPAAPG